MLAANEVRWSKWAEDHVVYCDANSNPCPPGVAPSKSGYLRLLLWR